MYDNILSPRGISILHESTEESLELSVSQTKSLRIK